MGAGGVLKRSLIIQLSLHQHEQIQLHFLLASETSDPVVSCSIPAEGYNGFTTFATDGRSNPRIVHLAIWIVISKNPDANIPEIKGTEALIC